MNTAFLELLNATSADAEHWLHIMPDRFWQFRPEQSHAAQQLLRRYLEFWIDSGIQPDGSEEPERRSYTTWDCQAIFETMEELLNSKLILEGTPMQTVFGLQAKNEKQSPQSGCLSIWFEPRGGIRAVPVVLRGAFRPDEPEKLAAYGFVLFWQSPWLFTLMRCAHCGVFATPSRKVRKRYAHGWHCERCRKKALTMAATRRTREKFRAQVLASAVRACLEYESKPRRAGNDLVQFITDRVNAGLKPTNRIKRNTITRNLATIRQKATAEKSQPPNRK